MFFLRKLAVFIKSSVCALSIKKEMEETFNKTLCRSVPKIVFNFYFINKLIFFRENIIEVKRLR